MLNYVIITKLTKTLAKLMLLVTSLRRIAAKLVHLKRIILKDQYLFSICDPSITQLMAALSRR